jgi:hypothetical protein
MAINRLWIGRETQWLLANLCHHGSKDDCKTTFGAPECWGKPVFDGKQAGSSADNQCGDVAVGERELCSKIRNIREKMMLWGR